MRQFVTTVMVVALVLAARAAGVAAAPVDDVVCTDSFGAVTVDNLHVPDGASCTLRGTRVEGNITVGNGATLTAWQVDVDGNIQPDGAALVKVLAGSTVGGNIQIEQGGAARVDQVEVDGDIQLESNNGALSVTRTTVGGNVQVFQNSGGAVILDNVIDENLQCQSNTPAPTGGNNVVGGDREDQCAALAPGDTTPPDTTIVTGPPATTSETTATFTFGGSDNATPAALLLFECALDGGAFAPCDASHTVSGLTSGGHQLQVRGLDLELNTDPAPAVHAWTVSGAQPTPQPPLPDLPNRLYLPFSMKR